MHARGQPRRVRCGCVQGQARRSDACPRVGPPRQGVCRERHGGDDRHDVHGTEDGFHCGRHHGAHARCPWHAARARRRVHRGPDRGHRARQPEPASVLRIGSLILCLALALGHHVDRCGAGLSGSGSNDRGVHLRERCVLSEAPTDRRAGRASTAPTSSTAASAATWHDHSRRGSTENGPRFDGRAGNGIGAQREAASTFSAAAVASLAGARWSHHLSAGPHVEATEK
mmetsp:Transcript_4930/g.13085  ORF Transcript_4930/g.13085 Transcript_4930/m.13085 type:complete len:228 (-) Transcript_4930:623-1306(-)